MDGVRRGLAAAARRAWVLPAAAAAVPRLWLAARSFGEWTPHLDRGEGYYEGAVNFLGYGILADRLPSLFPSGSRGPLYQAFLVAVESLVPAPQPGWALLAQALLSCLAVVAVYELASELDSPWAGLLAALWAAADPGLIEPVARLDISSFYQTAVLAAACALVRWLKSPTPARTALLAAVLAASLLCRTSHWPLPAVIAGAAVLLPSWRAARARLAALTLATAALLAVAGAAGAARLGRAAPLDVEAGALRLFATTRGEDCCSQEQIRRWKGAGTDRELLARAFADIRERPLAFASGVARNAAAFWSHYAPALLLAAFALLVHGPVPAGTALACVLLSFTGYHVLATYRWHSDAVLLPLLALAGAGAAVVSRRLFRGRLNDSFFRRPASGGAAGGALVAVFAALCVLLLLLYAVEAAGGRASSALGDPASPAHRAPLALLDRSVAASRGAYGLAERSDAFAAAGLAPKACDDLARLARVKSDRALAARARRCRDEAPLAVEGLRLAGAALFAESASLALRVDLPLAVPCEWPGWSRPESGGGGFLDRCAALSPRNPFARHNRGILRYLRGDKPGALEDFRAAAAADPAFIQPLLSLSTVLHELGRKREALETAGRAERLARASGDDAMLAAARDALDSSRR